MLAMQIKKHMEQLKIWVGVFPACAHLGAFAQGRKKRVFNLQVSTRYTRSLKQLASSSLSDAPPMDHQDWRAQLTVDGRRRIINLLLECFRKHSPCSAQEELVRFEEHVYSAASSKIDYHRKISAKCLTLESKSQSATANSLQIGAANASGNSSDLASASHIVLEDWRARIPPGSRERVTNKILETFKMHLPCSGQEDLHELESCAVRFEQMTFSDATSEAEYLNRIYSKMLALPAAVSEWSAANSLAAKFSDLGINK